MAATGADLSLPWLVASKHPHTPPKWSLGSPASISVTLVLQAAKGACLLCTGAQDWDTQSDSTRSLPRASIHVMVFLFLLVPAQGCHPHLILFPILPDYMGIFLVALVV